MTRPNAAAADNKPARRPISEAFTPECQRTQRIFWLCGLFTNHPKDRYGPTFAVVNYGVTLKQLATREGLSCGNLCP